MCVCGEGCASGQAKASNREKSFLFLFLFFFSLFTPTQGFNLQLTGLAQIRGFGVMGSPCALQSASHLHSLPVDADGREHSLVVPHLQPIALRVA